MSNPSVIEKTKMSDDFDITFDSPSPCCGEGLDWVWEGSEHQFEAECGCMKRYHLKPLTAHIEHDKEDFEEDDD